MREAGRTLRKEKIPGFILALGIFNARRVDNPVPDRKDQDVRDGQEHDIHQQRFDILAVKPANTAIKASMLTNKARVSTPLVMMMARNRVRFRFMSHITTVAAIRRPRSNSQPVETGFPCMPGMKRSSLPNRSVYEIPPCIAAISSNISTTIESERESGCVGSQALVGQSIQLKASALGRYSQIASAVHRPPLPGPNHQHRQVHPPRRCSATADTVDPAKPHYRRSSTFLFLFSRRHWGRGDHGSSGLRTFWCHWVGLSLASPTTAPKPSCPVPRRRRPSRRLRHGPPPSPAA